MMENKDMEELKETYIEIKLGDIAYFQKGFAFKSKDFENVGRKIVKVSNLTDQSIDINSCVCLAEKLAEKYERYSLNLDDIIITTVGSWPTNPASVVGKVIKVPKKAETALLNQNAVRIRANEKITQKYLYYVLKYEKFKNYIINTAQGSASQASITQEDIKNYLIKLPSLETQEKIASILSALDDKIELNNEMNKTLEEMAETLFKRWFIDFDFPNENGEPYRSSGGKMVDSELGEIPEGWEVTKIENVVNIKRGASPRPIQDYISDDGIPWIKISDATSSISKFLNKTNEFIIEKGKEKSRFIERGTLVLSNSATPGIPMIVNLDACVHDGWLIFNEYKNITKEFLYYVLKYHKENILALSNGSVFRNLKTDILKNYKIILPNLDLIILFNQSLEIIDKYIRNNVEEIQSLTEIRDTLLPKLMSGEIDM